MKNYKTIYVDMDGVLAQFTKAVIKQVNNITGSNNTINDVINKSDYRLEHVWNLSVEEWWECIDRNPKFWLDIEPFPWALDLINDLQQWCDDLIILTAPSQNPLCAAHKIQWCYNHLGVHIKDIIIARRKYLLANPHSLLVDDAKHNVDGFRGKGGDAVLVPSDWNMEDLNYCKVKEALKL